MPQGLLECSQEQQAIFIEEGRTFRFSKPEDYMGYPGSWQAIYQSRR